MISSDLIGKIASEHNVDPGIIEKDYVISKVLTLLARRLQETNMLVFKGGTALKKFFYPSWRYSEDLDFTATAPMKRRDIENLFTQITDAVSEQYGMAMRVNEYSQYPKESDDVITAQLKLGYDGPLRKTSGLKNNIRVDIAFDEKIVEKPKLRDMLQSYPDDEPAIMPVYTLEEIVAEKMRSILQRGKSRDYYDVWLLLKDYGNDFDHGCTKTILIEKCRFKQIPEPSTDDFFNAEQLAEASRFWERGLAHQLPNLPTFSSVKESLYELIGNLNGNNLSKQ